MKKIIILIPLIISVFVYAQSVEGLITSIERLKKARSHLKAKRDSLDKETNKYLEKSNLSVDEIIKKTEPLKSNIEDIDKQIEKIDEQITQSAKKLSEERVEFDVLVAESTGLYSQPMVIDKYLVKPLKKLDKVKVFGLNESGWLFKTKYEGQTCYVHKNYVKYDIEDYKRLKIISEARKSINKNNKPTNKKINIKTSKKNNLTVKTKKSSRLGFKIISNYSKWEGDRFRVIGEIKNIDTYAKGVQIEAIARDNNGQLVKSVKFWPASINNIPPGNTTGIGYTVTHNKRAKYIEIKIISTKKW